MIHDDKTRLYMVNCHSKCSGRVLKWSGRGPKLSGRVPKRCRVQSARNGVEGLSHSWRYQDFESFSYSHHSLSKVKAFQDCTKIVRWVHPAKTDNSKTPKHIQEPQISINTTQIPPGTSTITPRYKTPKGTVLQKKIFTWASLINTPLRSQIQLSN